MEDKDDILKQLSNIISGYLNGKIIWSHFSDHSGTTRAAIVKLFFNSSNSITSENIREKIVCDIGRDLSEIELNKLDQILNAWREWGYIIEQTKYNNWI